MAIVWEKVSLKLFLYVTGRKINGDAISTIENGKGITIICVYLRETIFLSNYNMCFA